MRHAHFATALFVALAAAAAWAEPASSGTTPHAVKVARATAIPACTLFVDAAAKAGGDGTAAKPTKTIAAAVEAAESGAVICVAAGTYAEELKPGEKYFTLAGGFKPGSGFKVRDSAAFVSHAKGKGGGSFLKIEDPGPINGLTAIDGFEISGYSQAILRDFYEPQRFDLTNNYIHDNVCTDETLAGAGAALVNISGTIRGNVFEKNSCGRGGALFVNDAINKGTVIIEANRVDGNAGTEAGAAHGGAFYLFANTLKITGNEFTNNVVTQWGAGLYVGAFTPGNQPTTATLSGNVYRANRAGDSGGGFFCDDGATCIASNEIYDANCGGNILVDGGSGGSGPTTTRFDHITNVGALTPDCKAPGIGLFVDTYEAVAPDSHTVTNSIFWGNGKGQDLATSCGTRCGQLKVNVSHSLVDTKYGDGSVKITFGPGIVAPADPLFVAPDNGDFRLQDGSPAAGKAKDGSDLGAAGKGDAAEPSDSAAAEEAPAPAEKVPAKKAAEKEAPAEKDAADQGTDASAKEAFKAAKELGTLEAWQAFVDIYPKGFHADLARAYIKILGGE